jgi:hypothetical protein
MKRLVEESHTMRYLLAALLGVALGLVIAL